MRKIVLLCFLVLLWVTQANAQVRSYPDSLHRGRLVHTLIGQTVFVAGGLSILHANWYKDRERVPLTFYNDAAGYKQVDKVGHAYGAYGYSLIGYRSLRRAGVPKKQALWWGGGLGMYFQTPIEIFDGLYEGWGFSWSDMAANAVGTALFVGQEMAWDEQQVLFKFSFQRSEYADQSFGYLGDRYFECLLNDYNGHTYWLSLGLDRLVPSYRGPKWLNLAVGYGAGGMLGEFENRSFYRGNRLPVFERHREIYLSPDVNWSAIPTRSPLLRAVLDALNFIKVPAPAVIYNTTGNWEAKWIYF